VIGFIGAGNMAKAIINGMIKNGIDYKNIYIHHINITDAEPRFLYTGDINIVNCTSNLEVVDKCKYIFLAVKPDVYEDVLSEIKHNLTDDKIIITMAAGYEINMVKKIIGTHKIVRTMPNTPALVNQGFTIACFDELVSNEERKNILKMLETFGIVQIVDEDYIDAYSAISGSGPAYVFMMIEAMTDAAVLLGIPRKEAYKAVQYTIIGSAKLALESDAHPGELKDMVCSPGGTTIEGIRTLEEKGFRSSLIECIVNTYKKNLNITNIR
jgi:pyrroline-5-carboxylate reductase